MLGSNNPQDYIEEVHPQHHVFGSKETKIDCIYFKDCEGRQPYSCGLDENKTHCPLPKKGWIMGLFETIASFYKTRGFIRP